MDLDLIKNKIIISGAAGTGKTRIVKDYLDKEGSIITSLSKSASAGTYSKGRSTTKVLMGFFIFTKYFDQFKKEVRGLDENLNQIVERNNIPDDFKYVNTKKQVIDKKMLLNFIYCKEDKINEAIPTRSYTTAMERVLSEEDCNRVKAIRMEKIDKLWEHIDIFVDEVFDKKIEIYNKPKDDIKLVFDEFTMIDSRRLEVIITLLQSRYHITHLVLVGDVAQLPSVSGKNVCNDNKWLNLLDEFKQYKLMTLWRFKDNLDNIITRIIELPYLNEKDKLDVCKQINDIMSEKRNKYAEKDIQFAISFLNKACLFYEDIIVKNNVFRDIIAHRRSSSDLMTKSKKIDQLTIDYFNEKDISNKIYSIDKGYLSILDRARYKKYKLFQAFWNNKMRCYHSATVHKMQGITVEDGIKTSVDLQRGEFFNGLAYTAITRNSNFDDVVLVGDIAPDQFKIPSLYNFKFFELHDYEPLINELQGDYIQ